MPNQHPRSEPVEIDGSAGEGGGQVLRTSLALAALEKRPLRITNIRARRDKPGLRAQHLAAVHAAATLCNARLEGAAIGSMELAFIPSEIRDRQENGQPEEFMFDPRTAGSTSLIFQTIVPLLLARENPARVVLRGGTHNPMAPPFEYLERVFLPRLHEIYNYDRIELRLHRPGFYPAGGGKLEAKLAAAPTELPAARYFEPGDRGPLMRREARALISGLRESIAERELEEIRRTLGFSKSECIVENIKNSKGSGNAVLITLEFRNTLEIFSGFAQKRVSAERVARTAASAAHDFIESGATIAEYTADQLLLPLALGAGGKFSTTRLSGHTLTNMEVIRAFRKVRFQHETQDDRLWTVRVEV